MGKLLPLVVFGALLSGATPAAVGSLRQQTTPVQTDRSSYVARCNHSGEKEILCQFTVIASLHNLAADTMHLHPCMPLRRKPIYGIELADTESQQASAYDPVWACAAVAKVLSGPRSEWAHRLALPPGGLRTDTFHVFGPRMVQEATGAPIGVMEGRFRLQYKATLCRDSACRPAPDSLTTSNAFEVRMDGEASSTAGGR